MAKELKLRRGTTAEHSTFTGAEGEVTVDTTKDTVVVHDGATAGGVPLAKEADIPTGALASLDSVDASTIDDNSVGAAELNVPGNGSSGQYLASDGDGTMTWTDLPAGGGFSNMQVFTSPGTWTNPGSVTKVKVTVVGGGGAGGGGGPTRGGGGGSGAGMAIEVIPFPSGTNVPVTVGSGGSATTGNGGAGGTSSFGGYCSATGGGGGVAGTGDPGGTAGSGSGGTINITGTRGEAGTGNPQGSIGGAGGASGFGSGAPMSANPFTPSIRNATIHGGGGAGGSQPPRNTSGSGKAGIVIVEF